MRYAEKVKIKSNLENSEGCNANGPKSIHLFAPYLDVPITNTDSNISILNI